MADQTTVPPERVVQELCADPLGRALWERAQYRVLSEVLAERVDELQQQRSTSLARPADPDTSNT